MNVYDAKCPNCQHAFKINDEQLAIKNGYVRCSRCKTIFSAAEQLQFKISIPNSAKTTVHSQPTSPSFQTVIDNSDKLLFDDEAGLDESGNIVIDKSEQPASPYAITKTKSKSSLSQKTSPKNKLEIIEDFDRINLNTSIKSSQKGENPTERINDTTTDNDNLWLENLLNEASQKEETEVDQEIPKPKKRYGIPAFSTDILDQIEIVPETEPAIDLAKQQQKIEQRLSKQVSSQHALHSNISGMNLIWGIGSVLLVAGLLAQYVIFNVNELMTAKQSATRLAGFCQSLSLPCNLPIADTQLIAIDTLKLTNSSRQAGQTDLIFTLTNTTDNKLIYPNLKVSLRSGNTIQAQTLLTPSNYVETGNSYLMPNQIKPIKIRIDFPKHKIQQANIEPFY